MKVARLALASTLWIGCVGDWSAVQRDGSASEISDADVADEAAIDPLSTDSDASSAAPTTRVPSTFDADVFESALDAGALPSTDAGPSAEAGDVESSAALLQDAVALLQDAGDAGSEAGDDAALELRVAIASVDTYCVQPLELACAGHDVAQKLVCLNGKWSFNGSCDGQTRCDTRVGVTQGTCQQITPACTGKQPGDAFCDGLSRALCGADLLDQLPAACGAHAHCDASSATCSCDRGFAADPAGACQDIVDCPANACSPGGRCVDGVESFTCACESGFQPSGDARACLNIDDCKPNICGEGGTCHDGVNAYQCTCASGYAPNASSTACVNPNDCPAVDPCSPGTCQDGLNTFSCSCPAQYVDFGTHTCEYFDPCAGGCGA